MAEKPGNIKELKLSNRLDVLNKIKENEPVSRQRLTKLTGLTPAAMTGIIRALVEMELVKEIGLGDSVSGRRPIELMLNSKAGGVLGVEIRRREIAVGVADLKNVPEVKRFPLDMTDADEGLSKAIQIIAATIAAHKQDVQKMWAVGIAFPGLLNVENGVIQRSTNLGKVWTGFPLKAVLEEKLGLPVYIESNVNASVLGEKWYGNGKDYANMVYINAGEGISGGIIIENRLLPVFEGHPGAVGHIVMQEDGPLCTCGNRGCLEAFCSTSALTGKANKELMLISESDPLRRMCQGREVTIEDIFRTAFNEDCYSTKLLQITSRYLGRAVADVINLYHPEAIFIGGKLTDAPSFFLAGVQCEAVLRSFPDFAGDVKVLYSNLADRAGTLGACALALSRVFSSNTLVFR